jgi:hypothetical protein
MKATPGIISGTGKRPTVVSPTDYKDRFRQSTWNYFTMAPTRLLFCVVVVVFVLKSKQRNTVLMLEKDPGSLQEQEVEPQVMISYDE